MADQVRLDLQVGLDTAYLTNQLRTIGSRLAGQQINLQATFDRRTIANQYRALSRYLGGKKFDVKIESNTLEALEKRAANFKKALQDLGDVKIDVGIGAVKSLSKRDAAKIKRELRNEIVGEERKIFVPVSIRPAITNRDVRDFKNAVQSKLSGITIKIKTDLEAASIRGGAKSQADIDADVARGLKAISEIGAARMAGGAGVTESARREQLKQSLSSGGFDITQLKAIGSQLGVGGVGRFRNAENLINKIVTDASIEMVKKYLDPQAVMRNVDRGGLQRVLDTFARGVFNMLGMDPASMMAAERQKRLPSPISFPATVPPRNAPIGPSNTGRLLTGAPALTAIGGAPLPAGLLPSITQTSAIRQGLDAVFKQLANQPPGGGGGGALVDTKRIYAALQKNLQDILNRLGYVIEVDVSETSRGLRDSLNAFAYVAQALKEAESRAKNSRIDDAVDALIRQLEGTIKTAAARARVVGVEVTDVTRGIPLLRGAQEQLMLPGAGQTSRRLGGGFVPEGGFPSDGMAQGPQGPKNMLSLDYYKNAFKYAEALKVASASTKNFQASQLPLVGGLRGIALEFGEATKQVLLYGTAYKGLAFITALPGNILNAAKSQQQYNNAMQVATQETGTFAKEMLFVDNVQRAFGLNLETTRQGFTRLYASMAPANFDSGSIERLFTGISAATAALQLTPDKAERVIYAFGQMASKGQVMSEELKGQLGDVLPGALSIFAKAAGKSVKEFNAELEKGVYSGSKFRELMTKVTDELISRFGTGAQAAGRSLQGLVNTVQGDFQRTLESFAPLADAAARAVLGPLSGALKQLSTSAQIAMGEMERIQGQLKDAQQVVIDLKVGGAKPEQIKAAEQNVAALKARYDALNQALQDPAVAKQVQDIQALIKELSKAGTFVMNVAGAIGSTLSPIINLLGTNLTTVISLITSFYIGFQTARLAAMALMGALLAYRTLSSILGFGPAALSANALATAFNALGIAANGATIKTIGLRTALIALTATTVVGAVVGAIALISGSFLTMGNNAKQAAQDAQSALQATRDAAIQGGVAMVDMQLGMTRAKRNEIEEAFKVIERLERAGTTKTGDIFVGKAQKDVLKNIGIDVGDGNILPGTLQEYKRQASELRKIQKDTYEQQLRDRDKARRVAEKIGLNQPTPGALPPDAADPKAAEKAAREAQKLANQQQQAAIDAANRQNALNKTVFEGKIALDNDAFDHFKKLEELRHSIQMAGLNSIQAAQQKHLQELEKIELDRIERVRKARQAVAQAELEYTAAQNTAAASGSTGGTAKLAPKLRTGGMFQGFRVTDVPGSPRAYRGGTHEGYDIATPIGTAISYAIGGIVKSIDKVGKGNAGKTVEVILNNGIVGMSMHLSEVLVKAGQRFEAGQIIAKTGDTGAGPAHLHQESAPHAYKSGQAAASLAYLQLGKGVSGKSAVGSAFSMARRADKAGGKLEVEQTQALNKAMETGAEIRYATIEAIEQHRALIANNMAAIYPIAEQKLENNLLAARNALQAQGMPEEVISAKIRAMKADMEATIALDNYKRMQVSAEAALAAMQEKKTKNIDLTQAEKDIYGDVDNAIALLTGKIDAYKKAIEGAATQQQGFNEKLAESLRLAREAEDSKLMGEIKKETPLGGRGLALGFIGEAGDAAAKRYESLLSSGASQEEATKGAQQFGELQNQLTLLETRNNAIRSSILGIGDAFATAMTTGVASLVDGTSSAKQVFADFLKNVGQILLQAAQQMIATYIAIGIARIFAGLGGGNKEGGLNFTDMNKYSMEGPISAGMFGAAANGAYWEGGFQAFANGGVVNGPTLGLVGEGNDSEYIIPSAKMSEAMSRYASGIRGAGVIPGNGDTRSAMTPQPATSLGPIDVRYSVERINSVDYVTADQFQRGMAMAAQQGAAQGQQRALAQLQQNTSVRRRLGL